MNTKFVFLFLALTILLPACSENNADHKDSSNDNQSVFNTTAESRTSQNNPVEAKLDIEQAKKDYQNTTLKVLDISERSKDGRNSIAITLSVPLDPSDDQQGFFGISQADGKKVDGAWVVSQSGKTIWFPYVEPETKYQVTVYQGLTAINGKTLNRTEHSDVVTSRIKASFNFDSRGAFLTQGLGNGLPVVTVNVDEVDINFFRVRTKNYQGFLREMSDRQYYWGIDRVTQFADLVYSGRFEFDAESNTRTKSSIDIESIEKLKSSGIYLAVMAKAGSYSGQKMMWFTVTDIGLHARFYDEQLVVYASSLLTGKAIENAQVKLINKKGEILHQALTSPNGEVSFSTDLQEAALIIAQNEAHFSVIEINKPALDLSEFDLGMRPSRPETLFIYGPRDLYRPGELADFSALLRDADGQLVGNNVLTAAIKNPSGTKIKSFKWRGNDLGYFQYQWQIPTNAAVGNWRLEVASVTNETFSYDFKVEEFLPERMALTFEPNGDGSTPVINKWQTANINLLGAYLYGAPAAKARLSTDVNVSLWRKPIASLPEFEFGDIKQSNYHRRASIDDIQLNDAGEGSLQFKEDWSDLHSPLNVKFVSSLYESGGRPVTRSQSVLVWPTETLIGIKADFGDDNPAANSQVRFELVNADIKGAKHSAQNLDIKLIKEDRRYFWVYSDQQGWHYQWNDNEYIEMTASVNIPEGGEGEVTFPVSWGRYRIEVRDTASQLMTSQQFYAGRNWYEDWQNSRSGSGAARPDRVTMALDKAAYSVGDTAKVNIIPPAAGEAIVTVESDKPLWSKRLFIAEEGATIEIPIGEDWHTHNIYISSVVLQPGNKLKSMSPKRSFGLVHLPLQRAARKLNIDFEVAEKVVPNKTLPVKIKVTDPRVDLTAGPSKKEVFVTLAAVDIGVINVSNYVTPDPFSAFFGQRRYQVDSRDIYGQVIELSQSTKAKIRFGGDNDLTRGGDAPQSDVQIVSIFSGLVQLDDNLEADIPLELPDFNGRIKLMALAFSSDAYGSNEQEVTVAAPVVTQIAMPRFIAMGDTTSVALDVTNLSGEAQTLDLSFSGTGAVKSFSKEQVLVLDQGEKRTLTYPVAVTSHQGQARFSLALSGDKLVDDVQRQWRVGARPAYPAQYFKVQDVLNQGEQLSVDAETVSSLIDDTVRATLSISQTANIDLHGHLNQLLQYPYGCLEQTSSRAFPLLFATEAVQQTFGIDVISEQKRREMVNKGFEQLASLQLGNGGFGLWRNTSNEEHWLTAYVADFLLNAREMGFAVPEEMLAKTLARLQQYLARSGRFYNERWSDNPKHYHFAYNAYAAYVLSRVNQVPLGTLRNLAKQNSRFAESGLSQTHLAIALSNMGDKKRGSQLLSTALKNLPQKRSRYLGDYGSQIRDLALMVHLMLKHDVNPSKAIALSFTLAEHLVHNQYFSTQERNALFLAGLSLKQQKGQSWAAELLIGSAKRSLAQSTDFYRPLTVKEIEQGVQLTSTFQNPLSASIIVSGYGKQPPKPTADGLSIERHWLTIDGQELTMTAADVGSLYLVQLEVNADQRTPDALIVDMIPAGFELENQNLEHAIKLDEIRVDGRSVADWMRRNPVKYQEFRDDRYVAAVPIYKRQTVNLFYLVRAVTPGKYKVPSPLVEDMYRPEIRGVGQATNDIVIKQK